MSNPVARESIVYISVGETFEDSVPAYRQVLTYCPGCKQAHSFTVEVFTLPNGTLYSGRQNGSPMPVWEWDGNLESPTFSPSMLAYYTVHLCPDEYEHYEECTDNDCDHFGHGLAWRLTDGTLYSYTIDEEMPEGATQIRVSPLPHAVEPAWGNCHSFLRNGRWEFLGDCAHSLANTVVPMEPLPDWLMKHSL